MKAEESDPLLLVGDVLDYLAKQGKPMTRSTWTAYVSRGQAPKPKKRDRIDEQGFARPRWRRSAIDEYIASHPPMESK